MTPGAPAGADDRRENARLVGILLGCCGLVLAVAAIVALAGWLPFSSAAARALTVILAVTGVTDLLVAFVFITRSRR